MKWFIKCIRNYVNFKGRARRSEYWYFILFMFLFMILAMILDFVLLGAGRRIFYYLFALFFFLPQLGVTVRRLHDTGRSGKIVLWYYVAAFIWIVLMAISGLSYFVAAMQGEFIGAPSGLFLAVTLIGALVFLVWAILFLVWFCMPGTVGENKYGPDPKAE